MRIKRFTPAAAALFNLIAGDIGRSLFDITHRLEYDGLAQDARAVFATLRTIEREIRTVDGRHLLARLLPYRTAEDRIGGAVLNFVDVTGLRQAEDSVRRERAAHGPDRRLDDRLRDPDDRRRRRASPPGAAGARHVFGYAAEEAIGQPFEMLFSDEDRARGACRWASCARPTSRAARPDERWMRRKDGSLFFASGVTARLRRRTGGLRQDLPRPHRDGDGAGARGPAADGGAGRRGGGGARERAQERVPGDHVARAEAPAQPDQRQRRDADGAARGAGTDGGAARRGDDPAHGPGPGADHRRPARHVAHEHGQAGASTACRCCSARRSSRAWPGPWPRRAARACGCMPRASTSRCRSTATRCGSSRSPGTCSATRSSSRAAAARSRCGSRRTATPPCSRSATPGAASRRRSCRRCSRCSGRATRRRSATKAGWASAWRW